jgi:hypothetical protein
MKAQVEFKPYMESREIRPAGWFRAAECVDVQRYNVMIHVEFTEEEQDILTRFNLWDTTVFVVPAVLTPEMQEIAARGFQWDTEYPRPLSALAEGTNRQFDSSEEAIDFQNEVKNDILPRIKQLILKHQNPNNSSEIIEL